MRRLSGVGREEACASQCVTPLLEIFCSFFSSQAGNRQRSALFFSSSSFSTAAAPKIQRRIGRTGSTSELGVRTSLNRQPIFYAFRDRRQEIQAPSSWSVAKYEGSQMPRPGLAAALNVEWSLRADHWVWVKRDRSGDGQKKGNDKQIAAPSSKGNCNCL